MRRIKRIILHCSATEAGKDFDVDDVRKWHKQRGWSDVGYHFVITLDGKVQMGRSWEMIGSHTQGHNSDSLGVCYIGGVKDGKAADTVTPEQDKSIRNLIAALRTIFGPLSLHGHNEFANKACPSFKVNEKYPELC
jgi:N-acetylmuramoyl-L-alanine amidase